MEHFHEFYSEGAMSKKTSRNKARPVATRKTVTNAGSQVITGVIVLVVGALIVAAYVGVRNAQKAKDEAMAHPGRSGESSGPPWPLPLDPAARIKAAGLSIGAEGSVDHYHSHLEITVDGKPVPVPANIGIDPSSQQMSPLHVHSPDGIIHVEASTRGDVFTVGQLFAEWNVKLTKSQMGALKAGNGKVLAAFVDRKRFTGDPASIRLANKRAISLVYGTPKTIERPEKYTFPKGL